MTDPATLGEAFVRQLRSELTHSQWVQMRADNAAEPFVCHSHDYLDANMSMLAACEGLGIDVWADDGMTDDVVRLWNAAWAYARQHHL